jgi:peptidoglycan L-alanyl-D-glutamate endopeptidase CwlK
MTVREKQALFWKMVAQLIERAASLGRDVVVLEWMRSKETQAQMVAKGASKTMNSKHCEGLAIDICFLDDLRDDGKLNYSADEYKELGTFWERIGGRWGGRFGDNPATDKIEGWDAGHFEYSG